MIEVHEVVGEALAASEQLVLPFERRQKSRQRATSQAGTEFALLLPRGTLLRDGDRLRAVNGIIIAVQAAAEAVSTARSADVAQFARVCYHLGNRHMPLQVGDGWLRYLQDHVLDQMVRELGLTVEHEQAAFEPEGGAYAQHEHSGSPIFRRVHGH